MSAPAQYTTTTGRPIITNGRARPVPASNSRPEHDATPALTLEELFDRLGWFVAIRWFAGVGALALVLIGWHGFEVRIPLWPVVLTVAVLFAYNAVFFNLVRYANRHEQISAGFINGCANGQIICDLITLAVLMHFTGGIENPFIVFFVCPMVIAAELLPNRVAYLHAVLGALLLNLVAWAEYSHWLPHVAVGQAVGAETYHNTLSVVKFTMAVSLLPFAVVFLGGSISQRLRQREAELELAHAQLSDLERSKSFLMRQTSHDLRSPVDTLTSMLRAAVPLAKSQCEARVGELLERAQQRAEGLTHQIDDLHRYAMLREVVGALHKEPLRFDVLVRESVGFYEALAGEQGLRLTATLAADAIVIGNRETLSELVSNLLSNAIQYTPAGGEVTVVVERDPVHVCLVVSDTGIGIPPAGLARVFDEFYRADNAKDFFRNGTGMGLPIVKRIATAHNGDVHVTSEVNRGTTFTVTLPAARPVDN